MLIMLIMTQILENEVNISWVTNWINIAATVLFCRNIFFNGLQISNRRVIFIIIYKLDNISA